MLKNYNLVGTEDKGFNAFYIRKDVHKSVARKIPKIKENEYTMLWKNLPKDRQQKLKERWNLVKHLEWVDTSNESSLY